MVLGVFAMTGILISTYATFTTDITSISLDKNYLDWNNSFPAISFCLIRGKNTSTLREFFNKYWSENNMRKPDKYMSYVKMVLSYIYHSPNHFIEPCDPECATLNETCGVNITYLRDKFVPKTCDEIIVGVSYRNRNYTCQELFVKYEYTEMGTCFIANSLHSVYVIFYLFFFWKFMRSFLSSK